MTNERFARRRTGVAGAPMPRRSRALRIAVAVAAVAALIAACAHDAAPAAATSPSPATEVRLPAPTRYGMRVESVERQPGGTYAVAAQVFPLPLDRDVTLVEQAVMAPRVVLASAAPVSRRTQHRDALLRVTFFADESGKGEARLEVLHPTAEKQLLVLAFEARDAQQTKLASPEQSAPRW